MRISKNDFDEFPRFAIVDDDSMVVDSLCFFTGSHLSQLCSLLNSKFASYYFFNNIAILDNGGMQMRQQYVEEIPLPKCLMVSNEKIEDNKIFQGFGFTEDEISAIYKYLSDKEKDILNR